MERGTTGGEDVRRQAETTVSTVAEQAQRTAQTQLASTKDQAASTLHTVAEAMRDSSQRLRQEQPQIASVADEAARRIEDVSTYVRQNDVRHFISEAERLARREPVLFLGGAFALGFVAARFLKASTSPSDERAGTAQRDQWYAVGPGRETGGEIDTFVGGRAGVEPVQPDDTLSGSTTPGSRL